jgi:hypothetical protein
MIVAKLEVMPFTIVLIVFPDEVATFVLMMLVV